MVRIFSASCNTKFIKQGNQKNYYDRHVNNGSINTRFRPYCARISETRAFSNVQWHTKCAVINRKCALTKLKLCSDKIAQIFSKLHVLNEEHIIVTCDVRRNTPGPSVVRWSHNYIATGWGCKQGSQQQQQVAAAVGCTNLHFRFLASISNLKLLTFLADISLLLFFAISETFAGWFDNAAWHSSRFDQRSCRNCRIPERPEGKRVRVKPPDRVQTFFRECLRHKPVYETVEFGVQHVHKLIV